jgi:hypothetical protein
MTTTVLNRSLLATLIGASLALGAGGSQAREPRGYAQDAEARTAKQKHEDAEQAKEAKQRERAVANANANARVQAQADRNRVAAQADARIRNERAQEQRAQMQARIDAARADREQARAEADARAQREQAQERAERNRAVADARADANRRERAEADARARAIATRNAADRNERVTPRPSDRAIERSPTHRNIRPVEGVPYGQVVSTERHRRNEERQADRNARDPRIDVRAQREAIAREQARERAYRDYLSQRQQLARQRQLDLQRANRMAAYRYQQAYYDRLRAMRLRDSRYDWYSDPFFSSRASYGYYRGGNYYRVNSYQADMLREAVRRGYEEGVHAGRADRMDGWRPSYRDSFAYQDALYGYRGYYVDRQEYAHYFREGFRRGYEDGYYRTSRYGRYDNRGNNYAILSTVLGLILNFRDL